MKENKQIIVVSPKPKSQENYANNLRKLGHEVKLIKKGDPQEKEICQKAYAVIEDVGNHQINFCNPKAYIEKIERRESDGKGIDDNPQQGRDIEVPKNDGAAVRTRHNRNKLRL